MRPRIRRLLVPGFAALVIVVVTACGQRTAVLGQQMGGCAAAVGERSKATAAIDLATEQAIARNGARAGELRAIATDGKTAIVTAADLGSCDDQSRTRGVAVDLADLRARYSVVIDRTVAKLDETAAKPAAPQRDVKGDNKGKGGGTKGG